MRPPRRGPRKPAPGARPGGRPAARRPGPARGPRDLLADAEEASRHLFEAHRLREEGRIPEALAAAGEAVRHDRRLVEAYLLLAELDVEQGDLVEAERAFEAARRRAAGRRTTGEKGAGELVAEALAGLARVQVVTGRYEQAAGTLRELMEVDAIDRAGPAELLAEVLLLAGHAARAAEVLPPPEESSPAGLLVASLARLELSDVVEASVSLRLLLFANLYLLARLLGEDPPDLGLVHGDEDATPEAALALAERFGPWLALRPEALDAIAAIAATPTVSAEVARFVDAARTLNREQDPGRRAAAARELAQLRDVFRLRASAARVLAERDDGDGPAPPMDV